MSVNAVTYYAVNGATMIVYCLCMFSLSYTKNGCVFCLAGLLNAFQFIWLVLMCVYFFSITSLVIVYKVQVLGCVIRYHATSDSNFCFTGGNTGFR